MLPTVVATMIPMELTTTSTTMLTAATIAVPPNTTGQHGREQKHQY
jgi:hypothetical protein